MDIVEFRGRRKDNGKWVYGDLLQTVNGEKGSEACILPFETAMTVDVIPETVGMFTGLYDCTKWEELTAEEQENWLQTGELKFSEKEWKGRKIFRGDIVKVDYYETPAVVEYFPGAFITSGMFLTETHDNTMRVIGNLYEHPQLLKR